MYFYSILLYYVNEDLNNIIVHVFNMDNHPFYINYYFNKCNMETLIDLKNL